MRNDYLSYYSAPLWSFCFIVVFLTMRTRHRYSTSTRFILAKILGSMLIVSCLVLCPGILEQIFDILSSTCNIHWDLREWRFRLTLDMFIVHVGMLVGVVSQRKAFHVSEAVRTVVGTISILIIVQFCRVARSFPDKDAYNTWHPYISPFPILAYVVLENSCPHV